MYDIRQFRPMLYLLVALGISGFCLAASSPLLWLGCMAAIGFNVYLLRRDLFAPIPRFVANILTVASFGVIILRFQGLAASPILVIGEFLAVLQVIKLYEQRANRDYAQLLVLSLLLMVAAAISTASLVFFLMFVTFLFLDLYCCLLFHLKIETDYAKRVMNLDESHANPITLRQDQRYLGSSMRRLTGAIATSAIVMAVLVFILFPRGSGQGLFGQQLQLRPQQVLTGFSGEMNLNSIARIQENAAVVARVRVEKNGEEVRSGVIYLRGATADVYDDRPGYWNWSRSGRDEEDPTMPLPTGQRLTLAESAEVDHYRQEIMLEPTGQNALFAMAGTTSFMPAREMRLRFSLADQSISTIEPVNGQIRYTVDSTGTSASMTSPSRWRRESFGPVDRVLSRSADISGLPPARASQALLATREFASRPEVSGTDADGRPLVEIRAAGASADVDTRICENIERYLIQNYAYTLDLTSISRDAGTDPILWFLTTAKKGHCVYFASAMTRMCHALGLRARTVSGFKCDNFNPDGGYFLVQQLHAHAWVEVLIGDRWQRFDPTAGRTDEAARKPTGVIARVKQFFDYLEYTWADSVVAYNQDSRQNILESVDAGLTKSAASSAESMNTLKQWFNASNLDLVSGKLINIIIYAAVAATLIALGYFFIERWLLMRRARRIGLDALPPDMQKRLARQLGFYDDLVRLLERRGITRRLDQTPLEFSNSLSYLPADTFDAILRLTRVFYRVRYGEAELGAGRRRWLGRTIERVDASLPV